MSVFIGVFRIIVIFLGTKYNLTFHDYIFLLEKQNIKASMLEIALGRQINTLVRVILSHLASFTYSFVTKYSIVLHDSLCFFP